ncbi:MAG: sigma-54 dependent transcriptional regulator [Thermodesulfobacteriota bacterium]
MNTPTIFIVDDENVAREGIALALRRGYRVLGFPAAEPALEAFKTQPPDLVLLDIGLPGLDGLEALRRMKELKPDLLVIMITAYEDVKTVVSAMKLGAYDYVVKPLDMDGLLLTVRNSLETIALRKEVQSLHEEYLKENLPCFIGESDAIQDVMDIVEKVSKSPDTPVLIVGETGTGKELIARAIHYRGRNFNQPLVTVNCAAIPKDLIESELFGYEKGAFSGADAAGKPGLVEKAANGTLFLDEVGDLSAEAQAKVLRFLEDGEFYRLGGTRKMKVKTRIISATNRRLEEMIAAGIFRKDLYYRLAVLKIEAPSLNQRPEDIMPMAGHFLSEFGHKFHKDLKGFSAAAEKALLAHHWTGNVRELKNMIERAALLAGDPMIRPADLGLTDEGSDAGGIPLEEPNLPSFSDSGFDLPALLQNIEKHYFQRALLAAGGNESRAAAMLNLSRDAFRYRRKHQG